MRETQKSEKTKADVHQPDKATREQQMQARKTGKQEPTPDGATATTTFSAVFIAALALFISN